jgi:hypothetical protein
MLSVCTWLWGDKFGTDDVARLAAGVRRNLRQQHRFICFADRAVEIENVECGQIIDLPLTRVRGCFARLRLFDPVWQQGWFGGPIVSIDLDTVITGPLDPLFDRPEPFVIMQKGNAANPCPFNGALMLLRPGAHPEVWTRFSFQEAKRVPFYEFPDDQGWLWHMLPRAAGWVCGPSSGVYVFRKPGWPQQGSEQLPDGARLVTFNGKRSPAQFAHLDWVCRNWIEVVDRVGAGLKPAPASARPVDAA